MASKNRYFRLNTEKKKEKQFKNLTDKITCNQNDITKYLQIEVQPMLLKSPPAVIIYGPVQQNEKFESIWA